MKKLRSVSSRRVFGGVVSTMLLGSMLFLNACVSGSKGLSAEEKEKFKPYILESVPADLVHKTDVNFENRVHLVGYKFEPELAKPGEDVKMTLYWRCDDKVDDGWMLFTHVHDEVSDFKDNLDVQGAIREKRGDQGQVLGPDRWERGKVYVDSITYKIPAAVKGPELTVYTGIWKGGQRLHVVQGPNDGDNRAIVGKIKTGLEAVKNPHTKLDVPTLNAKKLAAGEKIVIDGKADEKGWAGATSTGPFVDVGTGKPNTTFPVNGSLKLAWDDQNLYAFFEVTDPVVWGGFDKAKKESDFTSTGLPKLWTHDTVELMVDPDGDGDSKDYYELQINPQNLVFHSQFDTLQQPKGGENGPFGHEDWDPKLKSAVVVKGTIDKNDDKDEGYNVEVAIPWAAFGKAKNHPPKLGDEWRMNFYAMQDNSGVAWSPILGKGNFHHAPRFGRVTWVDAEGKGAVIPDAGAPLQAAGDAGGGAIGNLHPVLPVGPNIGQYRRTPGPKPSN